MSQHRTLRSNSSTDSENVAQLSDINKVSSATNNFNNNSGENNNNINLSNLNAALQKLKTELTSVFKEDLNAHTSTLKTIIDRQAKEIDIMKDTITAQNAIIEQLTNRNATTERSLETLKNEVEKIANKMNLENQVETKTGEKGSTGNKTFASLFKSKTNNEAVHLKALNNEKSAQEHKAKNIIVSGIPTSNKSDSETIKQLATDLKIEIPSAVNISTRRIGKEKHLVCATTTTELQKQFIKQAKNLRKMPKWNNIYINPDLTIAQLEEQYLLRKLLREKKKEEPDKEWVIKNGTVKIKTKNFSQSAD